MTVYISIKSHIDVLIVKSKNNIIIKRSKLLERTMSGAAARTGNLWKIVEQKYIKIE